MYCNEPFITIIVEYNYAKSNSGMTYSTILSSSTKDDSIVVVLTILAWPSTYVTRIPRYIRFLVCQRFDGRQRYVERQRSRHSPISFSPSLSFSFFFRNFMEDSLGDGIIGIGIVTSWLIRWDRCSLSLRMISLDVNERLGLMELRCISKARHESRVLFFI